MDRTILILNGPNLNLLGTRQPEIYGSDTLSDVENRCRALLPTGYDLTFRQSNHEGQLVDWIQDAIDSAAGIVINPGAFGHTSIAILDALNVFQGPVIEVHVSNIYTRESFRHHSFVTARANGVVAGFGIEGYEAAIRRVISLLE
ncbi:MAG: type II 3-dehydroquinate dehydratase [Pseudomonadota bacterium]